MKIDLKSCGLRDQTTEGLVAEVPDPKKRLPERYSDAVIKPTLTHTHCAHIGAPIAHKCTRNRCGDLYRGG